MSLGRRIFPARAYFRWWLHAVDEHSLHSPFLFQFYREVVRNNANGPVFSQIEQYRKTLLKDEREIDEEDPGAGSLFGANKRTVKDIARHSLSSPAFCRFLFRLTSFLKPRHLLEIGTSLGISAAYISKAAPEANFITIEGNSQIAALAEETFEKLNCHARLQIAKANEVLPAILQQLPRLDLVYIDAHHTEQATLMFFKLLAGSLHPGSVVVVGDIHWSAGMEKAWNKLREQAGVSLSIDLYYAGLLFFKPELRKETEILRF